MMQRTPLWPWLGVVFLLVWPAAASAQLAGPNPVAVEAFWDTDQARPGDQRVLAVVIDLEPKWHINPDEARTMEGLIPTTLEVASADPRLRVGAVQFPQPQQVEVNYTGEPATMAAYEGRAILHVPVVVSPEASTGPAALELRLTYQTCDDQVCLAPRTVTLDQPLEVVPPDATLTSPPAAPEFFAGFDSSVFAAMLAGEVAAPVEAVRFDLFGWAFEIQPEGLGLVLLFLVAAVGGMLLNFTPCVLPVIPIKIMGLSQAAGSRGRCFGLGLTMSLGVVAFWLALGGAIAFVSGFDAISELFQRVWFTIGVGVIIAVMAVAMTGVFAIPLPRAIFQYSPRHDTLPGSFGFGIMTAVLSTPCTAPFMGAAAAWATTQSTATTLGTFAAIGAGMALPYLVLAAMPELVQRVPRTGPASELVKQVMGLLMLAAAAYFIGVGVSSALAEPGESPTLLYWWPVAFFIALAGGWLAWRTFQITRRPAPRLVFVGVGAAAILLAGFGGVRLTDEGPVDWVYYTPERFAAALGRGHVVVLDFTAEWCLNCKALEHSVLHSDRVASLLDEPGVVPMKVDLTSQNNVAGWDMLREVGRVAIPALVVFAPDAEGGRETFNSDFYTPEQVVAAVAEARGEPRLTQGRDAADPPPVN